MPKTSCPAFITFTGADDASLCKGMSELSAKFPIEWGILVDRDKSGQPGFPVAPHIDRFRERGLRLCAHISGNLADDIVRGATPALNLGGFTRALISHAPKTAIPTVIDSIKKFANVHGIRVVLPCHGKGPPTQDCGIDWLYIPPVEDESGLAGCPSIPSEGPFCGIRVDTVENIRSILERRIVVDPRTAFWLETGSCEQNGGGLNLEQCREFCERIFGKN